MLAAAEITFRKKKNPNWWTIKTLTANENPPWFKAQKQLKQQTANFFLQAYKKQNVITKDDN